MCTPMAVIYLLILFNIASFGQHLNPILNSKKQGYLSWNKQPTKNKNFTKHILRS